MFSGLIQYFCNLLLYTCLFLDTYQLFVYANNHYLLTFLGFLSVFL
ncbi:hypothetical protein HMPREF9148_00339 [Prevotella sp. F0091]|nr:hypothetical protein HMPREF9148_00339 [Prevotella sp. F0091]